MSRSKTRSASRVVLAILVFAMAIALLAMPGLLMWPRMMGIQSLRQLMFIPIGLMTVFNLALAVWVGIDAERRCGQGILWAVLVFFTSIIGLVVYLLVCPTIERKAAAAERTGPSCPGCDRPIEPTFKLCPYCGHRLGGSCPECGRQIGGDWKLCPDCGTSLGN